MAFSAEVVELVHSVLGPRFTKSLTQKVVRWEAADLTVNVTRESRQTVTIWIAAEQFRRSGEIDLLAKAFRSAAAPKNSNCSPKIRLGPVAFSRLTYHTELEALRDALVALRDGEHFMETLLDPEIDAVESEQDAEALDLGDASTRVLTQTRDESVESLLTRIRRGRLILQPDFQRDYVWSKSKASALIESILMSIPLPVIYLAEIPDGTWEVVDGQQRLTAIRSFIEGTFPDGSTFRLGPLSVRDDLPGKRFVDLSPTEQGQLEDYLLRIILIQKEGNPDLKFEVFERLNSGAERLNDMELRNCIYRGPYNDMLRELAANVTFRKIYGEPDLDNRMKDRQLLLRFFAMWRNTHLKYRGPMKQFMNREMYEHRFATAEQVSQMGRIFEEAVESSWAVFGRKAFRRYSPGDGQDHNGKWELGGKLNIALWDTLMYCFTYYERRQIVPIADALREEFCDVLSTDNLFIDYIGRTTDKPDRVRYRAETWKRRIDALINIPAGERRNFSLALKQDLYSANSACAICGQSIHEVDDSEVDHIVHYWRGGRTIPQNARLVHRYCNRRRGAHEIPETD
jgi:5-methylcytosine-specific restriction endonuclease McrA